MPDKQIQRGNSLIQFGKENDRVYIMKSNPDEILYIAEEALSLCYEYGFTKIFAKVTGECAVLLRDKGFRDEAIIPDFGPENRSMHFMGLFLKKEREILSDRKKIDEIKRICLSRKSPESISPLPSGYQLSLLDSGHINQMINVFTRVFQSYPFPVFDASYLESTMESTDYVGIWKDNLLVSIASAEYDSEYKIAEMTDFATLPEYRGQGFAEYELNFLEGHLAAKGCTLFFTIARAVSPGMNITFRKRGYHFSGTLCKNTQISGKIESMNVWYKKSKDLLI